MNQIETGKDQLETITGILKEYQLKFPYSLRDIEVIAEILKEYQLKFPHSLKDLEERRDFKKTKDELITYLLNIGAIEKREQNQ